MRHWLEAVEGETDAIQEVGMEVAGTARLAAGIDIKTIKKCVCVLLNGEAGARRDSSRE